jgi:hypothetical protein
VTPGPEKAQSPYKCMDCWDDMGIVQLCNIHSQTASMLTLLREVNDFGADDSRLRDRIRKLLAQVDGGNNEA